MPIATKALTLAFILSATDKMSRVVDQAVKKSSNSLSSFERNTTKAGGAMMNTGARFTAAGASIVGAMIGMAKSTADSGNIAAKTARSVGMDAEEYQKLAYAAKYAGVDQQKLSASMVRFNKNIVDASNGSGKAAQIFKEMGISVKDSAGNLKTPNKLLAEVADKFKDAPDGPMKTATAYELLGRSGADMISLLNGGSAGLHDMGKEAEKLGLVISNDAAHASEKFCDNLDGVKDSARGVVFQMGAALIPTINETAIKVKEAISKITEWLRENPKLAATIGKVALVLGGLLTTVGFAAVLFGGLMFIVGKFAAVFRTASNAIKAGRAIIMVCKNSMMLFRVQYAAFIVWSKLAAAGQWLFNTSLYGCPIIWIIAGIMAVIAVVVLMVKYWDKIVAFFKRIWARIKEIFSKAWEGIKNIFLNYTPHGLIIKHWDKISAWFSNLWAGVKNLIGKAWEGIKNIFLNYTPHGLIIKHWDKISGWFSALWSGIKDGIVNVWNGIRDWFSNLNPVDWIVSAWENVSQFFSNLGSRFFEWGRNILEGLWNGITSTVDKVVEGVKNIGHKIAKGFKSIFGINSPSKLFAEYGLNITQGLVVGIDHGGSAVENATEGLAANTTSGISQSIQSSSVDASSTFNGGNSGATLNYSPQITITGGATPEVREEFSKLLRQHANEIISIMRRDAENTARLSFNG